LRHGGNSLVRTSRTSGVHHAGCSKRPDFSPAQPWRAETRLVPGKAAANYPFIRGGWDDPKCARPTRAFLGRALREHGDRSSHPAPFQHPDRREYHDSNRQSSLLGCNQELTLPTLTGQDSFIMVSSLLSLRHLRLTRRGHDLYSPDTSGDVPAKKLMNQAQHQS
jgi:hypothetical protein